MRKVAHYFYGDDVEIVVSVKKRKIRIRQPDGTYPINKVNGLPEKHPDEGDRDPGIITYEEVGLFYDYSMPGTGWDVGD